MPICSLRKLSWSSKLGSTRGLRFEQSTVTSSKPDKRPVFSFLAKKSLFSQVRATFFTKIDLAWKVVIPVTGIEPVKFLLVHFVIWLTPALAINTFN